MKNLNEFLLETLVNEVSAQTYKKAADKAFEIGDPMWKKFLDAYKAELEKLDTKNADSANKKVFGFYAEDKSFFNKLRAKYVANADRKAVRGFTCFYDKDNDDVRVYVQTNIAADYVYDDKTRMFLTRGWTRALRRDKPESVGDLDRLLVTTLCDFSDGSIISCIYDATTDDLLEFTDIDETAGLTDKIKEIGAELIGFVNPASKYASAENIKKTNL
jgi:hypothetical protein